MHVVMDKPESASESAGPMSAKAVTDQAASAATEAPQEKSGPAGPFVLGAELVLVAWALGVGVYFYRQLGFGDLILQMVGVQP